MTNKDKRIAVQDREYRDRLEPALTYLAKVLTEHGVDAARLGDDGMIKDLTDQFLPVLIALRSAA